MIAAQPDFDHGAAWMNGAEQPPVVLHLRFVVDDWGVSLCAAEDGVLVEKASQANCGECLDHHKNGTRCVELRIE